MKMNAGWIYAVMLLTLSILCFGCSDSSTPPPQSPEQPQSTDKPFASAAGIGVSDLEASVAFYQAIGMRYLPESHITTDYWEEEILVWENEDEELGSILVLMHFTSEKNYENNPMKLVFAVPDADAFAAAIESAGGTIRVPPALNETFGAVIGFANDLDGYLIEFFEVEIEHPQFIAVGIGVSDLSSAEDFYSRVVGMEKELDINVAGVWDEAQMAFPSGKGLKVVLINYATRDDSEYVNVPAKIVYRVDDAQAFFDTISEEFGGDPTKAISPPYEYQENVWVGMARDIDGYLMEIVQIDSSSEE